MDNIMTPFKAAVERYSRARTVLVKSISPNGPALEAVDDALDGLLAVPSPSHREFGQKLRILEQEYGVDAQPRHLAALFLDAAMLAWLMF